jgi:hypothetical protein
MSITTAFSGVPSDCRTDPTIIWFSSACSEARLELCWQPLRLHYFLLVVLAPLLVSVVVRLWLEHVARSGRAW